MHYYFGFIEKNHVKWERTAGESNDGQRAQMTIEQRASPDSDPEREHQNEFVASKKRKKIARFGINRSWEARQVGPSDQYFCC